jgi:hypothetical protein
MICKRVEEKTAWKDSKFAQSQNTARHDAWFRAKVREALDDLRPGVPHKRVKAHFAKRRSTALRKTKSNGSYPPHTSEDSIPHLKIEMWGTRPPAPISIKG